MLDALDSLVECCDVVVGRHQYGLLRNDGSVVDLLVDEVDRHAGHGDAVVERLLHGIGTGKRRQQRRMNIDDRIGEPGNRLGCENSHEAGQDQGFGAVALRHVAYTNRGFMTRWSPPDVLGGDPGIARSGESAGIISVGQDHHDPVLALGRSLASYERFEVCAAAGNEDSDGQRVWHRTRF